MILSAEDQKSKAKQFSAKDQTQTPYFDALKHYIDSGVTTFHVPGHQQGKGVHEDFRNFVKKYGLAADVSQVMGLDDILQPESVVKEAQELAAKAYGTDRTFFLINGSSSGNHAMILAALNPGDKIILPRNVHRSTTGALILSGAMPVYMYPEYDRDMQVDHTVTPEVLEQTIRENPDAKAVLILSPTYYGAACDIKKMVEIAHAYDKPILVDEAWGPHFHFHPDLPDSATGAGADLVVNSTHKIIGGMAQASMLHVQGNRIDRGRLQTVIRLFLSTSPSCLLVASLDMARMNMATRGKELLGKSLELAEYIRTEINKIYGIQAFGYELVGKPGVHAFDGVKLTITARQRDMTGYEIERILRKRYNIQFEMSDLFNCLALITIGHTKRDADKIINAFKEIDQWERHPHMLPYIRLFYNRKHRVLEQPDWPIQMMSPRDAFNAPYETIPLTESVGRICSETVTPYPPGIPILLPGDCITTEIVDYILLEMEAGVHIQGPVDANMTEIRVVK